MAHFGDVSCVNCSNALGTQLRNLFFTEDFVYDAIRGLISIGLNFERHWCDATVLEAVIMPLIDVIESGERAVELFYGFVKPFIMDNVANDILSLDEGTKVSILKVYFQVEDYLSSELEDSLEESDEDSGGSMDSDTKWELAWREVWLEERERLKVFGENAWEVFWCAVFNENMVPFRNLTKVMEWWLLERSTNNIISIGEYVAMIYQALSGNM